MGVNFRPGMAFGHGDGIPAVPNFGGLLNGQIRLALDAPCGVIVAARPSVNAALNCRAFEYGGVIGRHGNAE